MISNYLKIARNSLLNHKLYSAINIFGLAVGLASCLMIAIFVRYELSFDAFFPDADRTYRLSPDFAAGTLGPERHVAPNVAPLGPLLAGAGLPGVEAVGRIGGMHALISTEYLVSYEDNFRWADPAIFNVFRFDWMRGTPEQALVTPDSVVISQTVARKYFGGEDPMGQVLTLENEFPLTVSGVIADLPANTHLSADLIVPIDMAWRLLDFDYGNNWSYTNFHTYLRLQQGADIDTVMAEAAAFIYDNVDGDIARSFGIAPDTFSLTPYQLRDIHLGSDRPAEFKTPGSLTFLLTFVAIAFCLLLIACVNFMNLSTARASRRAKEVGLRKAIGANRTQLVRQFLGESLLTTALALFMALGLTELLLPAFGAVVDRELDFGVVLETDFAFFVATITLFTAFLAGSYPALYLSGFKPARVLKYDGRLVGARGLTVRNVLVVFQFSLAIVLIVCTLVVSLQMRHTRDFDLGFNKDEIVVLWGTHGEGMGVQWEVMKRELIQHPDILEVTEGDMGPGRAGMRRVRIEGGAQEAFDMLAKSVGFNFFDTYQIVLVAGRDFDEALSTDIFYPPPNVAEGAQPTGTYILNETAVRQLGMEPEDVLGRTFEMDFSSDFSLAVAGPVIGVVEDVHPFSLREPMRAMAYFVPPERWGNQPSFVISSVRTSGRNVSQSLAWIEEKWAQFNPDMALYYHFLDSDYAALYQEEERQGQLFTFFAVLTIVIACLGLFGLATFTVEQRFKEIGVRKVMGGTVWSIVLLLTNNFSKLVLISNVIAWPIAYVAMQRWLEQFAYRIDLTPLVFIGSGLIALCIAWVTVGGTAAKAASAKPVLALRYE